MAQSASAAVPEAPNNIVVFPDRDFVTIEGYQDHIGETALVEVKRGGTVVGSAQGEVVELHEGRQPLLGVVSDTVDRTATHAFPTGSTLIVYTDGLVERRREPLDRSIDRLADALRSAEGVTSDAIASHVLVHSMVTNEPDDDVALIVVRRTT